MSERKQLTIWVSQNQKENWDEYQEKLGYQNRSNMVRRAVEYFYAEKTSDDTLAHELEDAVQTLNEDLQDDLYEIKRDIESIESSVREDPNLDILKADIYDELPSMRQEKLRELEMEGGKEDWSDSWSATTPNELANDFERPRAEIVRACEALRVESPDVKVREMDDQRFYYKQEVAEK